VPTHKDLPENWQEELARQSARVKEANDRAALRRAAAYTQRKRYEDQERARTSTPPPSLRPDQP